MECTSTSRRTTCVSTSLYMPAVGLFCALVRLFRRGNGRARPVERPVCIYVCVALLTALLALLTALLKRPKRHGARNVLTETPPHEHGMSLKKLRLMSRNVLTETPTHEHGMSLQKLRLMSTECPYRNSDS